MRSRGFTLIEMLTVLAITAILVGLAIPSLQFMMARSRSGSASGALQSAFDYARSEAIRRNQVVSVCRSVDPTADVATLECSNDVGAGFDGNDWGSGWIIFAKAGTSANASVFEPALDDFLLQRQQPISTGPFRTVLWSTINGAQRVAYRGDGMPAGLGSRFFIDYRPVDPPVADRDPNPITLTTAARCLALAAGTGRVRAYRPESDTCPTL